MKPRVGHWFAWLVAIALAGCPLEHPAFGVIDESDGGDDIPAVRDIPIEANLCGGEGMLCCAREPACMAGAVCAADNLCIVRCPDGQATCGGRCTNRQTDVNHCGACGNSCVRPHAASACVDGVCSVGGCDPGFADCNGSPADGCEAELARSATNCGACGVACAFANAGATCAAGVCARGACNAGFDDCNGDPSDGCEASINSSLAHCGRCGSPCAIPMAVSECVMGACRVNRCPTGTGDCNSSTADGCETDVTTSTANCGGCGAACAFAHGTAACVGSVCALRGCESGFGDCDGNPANGCEVNLATSASNCGACGRRCAPPNAMGACVAGACGVAGCNSNFANCDGNPANGCEVDTRTSTNHCGACGRACALANATATCAGGTCAVATCAAGFADCNGRASDGCETNVRGDLANCGGCGRPCAPANADGVCASGACGIARCRGTFADCNRVAGDGCESNTDTSLNNCGACGDRCAPANAMATCARGACVISRCTAPWEDCDGSVDNGCETNTLTSTPNCGGCGRGCAPRAHASAACGGGLCGLVCDAGFADCNRTVGDGCEVDLHTAMNCGACGTRCTVANGVAGCSSAGRCTVESCASGFENCDGMVSNGCEANTRTDVNNCRGCGMACTTPGAVNRCESGVCAFTCMTGRADCDGAAGNGCEVGLSGSVTHCGACGRACSSANGMPTCMAGTCRISCNMNFGDCDGMVENGCESDLQNNNSHCGMCGRSCVTPSTCSGTACR